MEVWGSYIGDMTTQTALDIGGGKPLGTWLWIATRECRTNMASSRRDGGVVQLSYESSRLCLVHDMGWYQRMLE